MLRKLLLSAVAAACLAPPAEAQQTMLMPGVTYTRTVEFTPRGPVVMHVLLGPKPQGLYRLRPVLANGGIVGRETLTSMQRRVSPAATVAGVNGDVFASASNPSGVLLDDKVLKRPPAFSRSTIAIDAQGGLSVQRMAFVGHWRGSSQRRPLRGLNDRLTGNGFMVYTPSFGTATPRATGTVEAVLSPFPVARPNVDLLGPVVQVTRGGGTRIPPGGAVLVGRGRGAAQLAAEAPVGQQVEIRLTLNPDPAAAVDALGGGPLLVRRGRPVFRAFEEFPTDVLVPRQPRTAVGQRPDGRVVLVSVDGRQPGYSVGMTTFALAQRLIRLGVSTGSGLGGGRSTAMAFDGALLNRPPRGREPALSAALMLFYYGVHAPPPAVPVLSPNGDGVAERQALSYKVVRPSTVTVKLLGPDNVPRHAETARRSPGLYRFPWSGRRADGALETPGRWTWSVEAVDDQRQRSSVARSFALNPTLGFLRVRPTVLGLRRRGGALIASWRQAYRAQVTLRVETPSGAVIRELPPRVFPPGPATLVWDGRSDGGGVPFSGRYRVRVIAVNTLGRSELARSFVARRTRGA